MAVHPCRRSLAFGPTLGDGFAKIDTAVCLLDVPLTGRDQSSIPISRTRLDHGTSPTTLTCVSLFVLGRHSSSFAVLRWIETIFLSPKEIETVEGGAPGIHDVVCTSSLPV